MTLFQSSKGTNAHCEGSSSTPSHDNSISANTNMSTATMDAPPTPMQVEVDVSIAANKAEEASTDKRKFL